jgi:succinyl-CoA synthetase beta subunit
MRLDLSQIKNRLSKFGINIHTIPPPSPLHTLYLGIAQDRSIGKLAFIASMTSGDKSQTTPKVFRQNIDPLIGLRSYQVLYIASSLNLPRNLYRPLDEIAQSMYRCFMASDATLLEINPLVITEDHELVITNARMSIDDNALFRQPDFVPEQESDLTAEAHRLGITYIELDGVIGSIVNGAGLAMATMDVISLYGAEYGIHSANFLDIGGGASVEKIERAFDLIRRNKEIKVLLLNIFGGMTHCDDVVQGLINSSQHQPFEWPVVTRLQGTNSDSANEWLRSENIPNVFIVETLTQGVLLAIEKVNLAWES